VKQREDSNMQSITLNKNNVKMATAIQYAVRFEEYCHQPCLCWLMAIQFCLSNHKIGVLVSIVVKQNNKCYSAAAISERL